MNEIKEWLEECKEKYGNLSGEQLKLIALFFMLLDHVGYRMTLWNLVDNTKIWIHIGDTFRVFGRIAFPIFAFLVAEGFRYHLICLRIIVCIKIMIILAFLTCQVRTLCLLFSWL